MYHKGEVISNSAGKTNSMFSMNFKLKMQSNPDFTAKIMLAYAKAVINLKNQKMFGAYTPLNIPISYLFSAKEKNILFSLC